MKHAVFAYGHRCASGISRIFSLNRGGQPDSTMGTHPPRRPVGPSPDPRTPERPAPKGLPRSRPPDCRTVHPGVAEHPRPQLVAGPEHRVGPRPTQPPTEGETVCSTHRTPPEKTPLRDTHDQAGYTRTAEKLLMGTAEKLSYTRTAEKLLHHWSDGDPDKALARLVRQLTVTGKPRRMELRYAKGEPPLLTVTRAGRRHHIVPRQLHPMDPQPSPGPPGPSQPLPSHRSSDHRLPEHQESRTGRGPVQS